jgi:hypothetical protein
VIKGPAWHGFRDPTHISLLEPKEWLAVVSQHFEVTAVGGDALWDAPYFPFIPVFAQKLVFAPATAVAALTSGRFPTRLSENLLIACVK